MAPETALDPQWVDIFSTPSFRKNLALIAIDEAHCICEWLAVTNLISVVDGSRSKLNSHIIGARISDLHLLILGD